MPAAIPAAVGLGGSIIGGISGKGAAKKQQKLAEQQMAMMKPLLDAQIAGSQYALTQSKPFLEGAGQAATDLQNFWKPLVSGNRSAIDQFLAPERRAINQGYKSVSKNLATFGPRGGGRVSSLANADIARQGALSDLVFGARKTGANQLESLAQLLGSLGTSTLSAGLSGGQQGFNLLNAQQNRAYDAANRAGGGAASMGQALGSFLGSLDLFKQKGDK